MVWIRWWTLAEINQFSYPWIFINLRWVQVVHGYSYKEDFEDVSSRNLHLAAYRWSFWPLIKDRLGLSIDGLFGRQSKRDLDSIYWPLLDTLPMVFSATTWNPIDGLFGRFLAAYWWSFWPLIKQTWPLYRWSFWPIIVNLPKKKHRIVRCSSGL